MAVEVYTMKEKIVLKNGEVKVKEVKKISKYCKIQR